MTSQAATPTIHSTSHRKPGRGGKFRGGGPSGSHRTSGGNHPPAGHSNPALADSQDAKELKIKFKSHLFTLRELFPDWTDEDLVFAIQEASGDIDVTIARISEGLSNQWGEVKKKRDKKQDTKSIITSSANTMSQSTEKKQPRGVPERGRGRGDSIRNRGGDRGRGGSGVERGTSSARPPRQNGNLTNSSGNATDSIQSLADQTANSSAWSGDKSWANSVGTGTTLPKSPLTAPTSESQTKPVQSSQKPAVSSEISSTSLSSNNAVASKTIPPKPKTSWAQIVKPEPKVELKPQPPPQPQSSPSPQPEPQSKPLQDNIPSALRATPVADRSESEDAKLSVTDTLETQSRTPADLTSDLKVEPQVVVAPPSTTSHPAPVGPPGFNKPGTTGGSYARRIKQEAAVVMPGQATPLDRVGLQFGSLSLSSSQDEPVVEEQKSTSINVAPEPAQISTQPLGDSNSTNQVSTLHTPKPQAAQQSSSQQASQPQQQPTTPSQPQASTPSQPQPSSVQQHQQQYPSASVHTQQQPHRGQQQQQQQQQAYSGSSAAAFGTATSAYTQPLTAVTTAETASPQYATQSPYGSFPGQPGGFGLGQSHEYAALYGNDGQRASLGYYDPTGAYGHAGYGQQTQQQPHQQQHTQAQQTQRDSKYAQDSLSGTTASSQGSQQPQQAQQQQAQQQAQQAYPNMGVPYYPPYYYVPNQFAAYGQSGYGHTGYGQPFVNQTRYPPYNQHQNHHTKSTYGQQSTYLQHQQQQSYGEEVSAAATAAAAAGSFAHYDRYGNGAASGADQYQNYLGAQQAGNKQSSAGYESKQAGADTTSSTSQYSQGQYGAYTAQQAQQQGTHPQQPQSAVFGGSGYGQYLGGYPQAGTQQRSQQYWSQ